jgi:hypothetical protein
MPDSDPTTHLLDVPGARLSYGRRGAGPLLLMIGSPMDSSGGAVVGLALVTGHPGQVRTLVAHEPPVVELLADAAQLRPDR